MDARKGSVVPVTLCVSVNEKLMKAVTDHLKEGHQDEEKSVAYCSTPREALFKHG